MKTILIVEDEPAQQLLYETEFQEMGFRTVIARDGEEAIDKVREVRPDVVILDLMLPRKHGLDALREVLAADPNLPVIIHTAYSHYKDDFMSWAAEEYVVKSSDLGELKKAVERVLARRSGDAPKQ